MYCSRKSPHSSVASIDNSQPHLSGSRRGTRISVAISGFWVVQISRWCTLHLQIIYNMMTTWYYWYQKVMTLLICYNLHIAKDAFYTYNAFSNSLMSMSARASTVIQNNPVKRDCRTARRRSLSAAMSGGPWPMEKY